MRRHGETYMGGIGWGTWGEAFDGDLFLGFFVPEGVLLLSLRENERNKSLRQGTIFHDDNIFIDHDH